MQGHRRWPPTIDAVRTEDGVDLHIDYDGDPDAAVTVVFTHGFTASSQEWAWQREAVSKRARVVFWDQRGHGRSSWTRLTKATIDQTGHDLGLVLDAATPTGPVVLAGHSMGGMTIMALARRRPELFGDRVVGVFLVATSAGGLEHNGLVRTGVVGHWVRLLTWLHLLRLWFRWLELIAPLAERFRRRGTRVGRFITRRYLFGRDDADPALVRQVQELLEQTPWTVTAAFYSTFIEHNEEASLAVLSGVPVTIVAAECDRLTPASHADRIAGLIGASARLIVVPGAGHSVNATRPEVVNAALLELIETVSGQRQQPPDVRYDPPDAAGTGEDSNAE